MQNRLTQCYVVSQLLGTLDKIVAEVAMRPNLGAELLTNMKAFESSITVAWAAEDVLAVAKRQEVPMTQDDVVNVLEALHHCDDDGISWAAISDTITNIIPRSKAKFCTAFPDSLPDEVQASHLASLIGLKEGDDDVDLIDEIKFNGETYRLAITANFDGGQYVWLNASETVVYEPKTININSPYKTVKDLIKALNLSPGYFY